MAYMLLIVEPVHQRSDRTEEEGRALYDRMANYAEDLRKRGLLVACESLANTSKAVRVQVREGQRRLIDGPFAEAKEMIGGFFLLSCETRAEAVAIAEACPAAQWCTVEVREAAPCYV
jgi:hypothetical protein